MLPISGPEEFRWKIKAASSGVDSDYSEGQIVKIGAGMSGG